MTSTARFVSFAFAVVAWLTRRVEQCADEASNASAVALPVSSNANIRTAESTLTISGYSAALRLSTAQKLSLAAFKGVKCRTSAFGNKLRTWKIQPK